MGLGDKAVQGSSTVIHTTGGKMVRELTYHKHIDIITGYEVTLLFNRQKYLLHERAGFVMMFYKGCNTIY